ncbi:polyketide synthase [Lentinula edodes]|uniref:Polyketide synthase n=1 Tax=Lentinula edodes TaxID=5353 RepID=A0A1Q3E8F8_LENED|nr:polyketide synthase [Lentinula edodes]
MSMSAELVAGYSAFAPAETSWWSGIDDDIVPPGRVAPHGHVAKCRSGFPPPRVSLSGPFLLQVSPFGKLPFSSITRFVSRNGERKENKAWLGRKKRSISAWPILSALELTQAGVDPNDFRSPETLLTMWMSRFPHNALISSSALVLMQLLQYLSFVERFGAENGSLRPFADLLIGHSKSSVGILGFSSGIVSACVVASSNSAKSYLLFALEAYRLALWIGIRCQLYRFGTSNADTTLPWSVVFLGISTEEAQEAISNFGSRGNSPESEDPSKLYITAVMDDHCVTVSGCPPILAEFTASVRRTLPSVLAHQTTVDTLYHSPVHLRKVRDQILVDVADRNIRFPELSHLRAPVRSTSTGVLLSPSVEPSFSVHT